MTKIYAKPWKDWLLVNFFGAGLLANIFIWVWLNLKIPAWEGSETPLHYSVEFGVDLWGEPGKLLILPALGLSILLINIFLAFFLWSESRVFSRILAAGAFICQIIILAVSFLLLIV